ncbi:MAG TPA: sortase [Candidatus Dormibacteraeota bacterium]|jgi:LPXTG-site transpeptidase (sortase) family protein
MKRNLIAGLLIAIGLILMATAIPALGLFRSDSALATPSLQGLSDPLSPPHQHAKTLPGSQTSGSGATTPVAYISVPRIGINNAPIFDRGLDGAGNMLIAKGYAITHYDHSSPIGSGNAVLYGHDDIEGSVFGRLQELKSGDEIDVTPTGASPVVYHVTGRTIVQPNAVQILNPTNDVRLTLFTCWPTWVDSQRLVVTAAPTAG